MMKKHLITLALIGIILPFISCNQQEMKITTLKCEYLNDPVGIESANPLLSWEMQATQRGKRQTAYRILAAASPSLLNQDKGDLWDSGIVQSDQSVHIAYDGKPLLSRQQIYWKVMVWDENERPSSWSNTATWTMALQPEDWTAKWITNRYDQYPDSVLTFPAPYFRKSFETGKTVSKAILYVSGLGFYEAYLNGSKVGTQVLAPAVTNYDQRDIKKILYPYDDQTSQRVLYNTFDVTGMLRQGSNTVGMILGNGWYNQRDRTVEGCLWYDTPRMILQMEIEYTDGSRQTINSDESWKCTTGPLLHDAIFTGEVYDARLELGNWNRNDYDDSRWNPALHCESPSGKLHSQLAPYDEITKTIQPVFRGQVNDSVYAYTLPEMVSGWAEIAVEGKEGDKVRLRFIGEEEEDFGQYDTYILKGGGPEKWEPRFTWHAFRYIELISKDIIPDESTILVKSVHTNPEKTGKFNSSNELFDKINEAYIRTQDANFHGSISSDCPHRERIAYTGDGQVVVENSIWSYDMSQFYRKWFDDMKDAQNKVTGYVPHTAPFAGGGGGPAWGSAYIIMPWTYYLFYGDREILRTHYDGMKHWVEYLGTRTDERGIVVREEPGGWCLGDWCTPGPVEIPEAFVNTAYYYHCVDLLSKIAGVLGSEKDAEFYNDLSARIKDNFNKVYFVPATGTYWEARQGANVFPLAFGMVPAEHREAVLQTLLEQLHENGYHFDTGILATPLILKVLSENNRADIAYRLMDQRSEPGYAYLLDEKYSCLWETWNGKASRCHPMFGSVVSWFYNTLAGIAPDQGKPGMKHMIIAPQPTEELQFCNAAYKSLYGMVRTGWKKTDGEFRLDVEIPVNTTATVYLPAAQDQDVYESGKPLADAAHVQYKGNHDGVSVIEIASGAYTFSVRKP